MLCNGFAKTSWKIGPWMRCSMGRSVWAVSNTPASAGMTWALTCSETSWSALRDDDVHVGRLGRPLGGDHPADLVDRLRQVAAALDLGGQPLGADQRLERPVEHLVVGRVRARHHDDRTGGVVHRRVDRGERTGDRRHDQRRHDHDDHLVPAETGPSAASRWPAPAPRRTGSPIRWVFASASFDLLPSSGQPSRPLVSLRGHTAQLAVPAPLCDSGPTLQCNGDGPRF